ncbi:MAG: hypothetical protein IM522_09960, partial [Pseudanabaena sp. M109S1SP1A06QC]|nr:hypothetical protein [Pseudanabaena sp. M109S1SP1A06QC]
SKASTCCNSVKSFKQWITLVCDRLFTLCLRLAPSVDMERSQTKVIHCLNDFTELQHVEALDSTEIFVKVMLSVTSTNISSF